MLGLGLRAFRHHSVYDKGYEALNFTADYTVYRANVTALDACPEMATLGRLERVQVFRLDNPQSLGALVKLSD